MGELILKESELVITFRKPREEEKSTTCVGWDLNLRSLDGFSPKYGWIRIDLTQLYHIHRVHEIKRKRVQSKASKKPSLKPVFSQHGRRERSRAKDFIHKLTTELARIFPQAEHSFEDLEKQGMYGRSKKHNRDIAKQDWRMIVRFMSYKTRVRLVDPRGTSNTCPLCGGKMIKLRKG